MKGKLFKLSKRYRIYNNLFNSSGKQYPKNTIGIFLVDKKHRNTTYGTDDYRVYIEGKFGYLSVLYGFSVDFL